MLNIFSLFALFHYATAAIVYNVSLEIPPPTLSLFDQQVSSDGPFQFGYAQNYSADLMAYAQNLIQDNLKDLKDKDKIINIRITSKNAKSLNFIFDDFHLPSNSSVAIIGQKERIDYKNRDFFPKQLSTWPLKGDSIVIQIKYKTEIPLLKLQKVIYGFRDITEPTCQVNAVCFNHIKQMKSIALMLMADGTTYCTGSLINNIKQDGQQLLLSANHCLLKNIHLSLLRFNYFTSQCQSESEPEMIQTVQGLKLLSHNQKSDFALFQITQPIPPSFNVYLNGFSVHPPKSVYSLHHPLGQLMKVSYYNQTPEYACFPYPCWEKPNHWQLRPWTLGSTAVGSSGAPLFNEQGLVIGQLHGGTASCDNRKGYDSFGALNQSLTDWKMRWHLTRWQKIEQLDGVYLREVNKNKLIIQ